MCASVNRDDAYIFGEVMVRVEGQGSCYQLLHTPHSISTLKVSLQTIMEAAICTIITQFKTHAKKGGPSSSLSRDEFHDLVSSQLPTFVQNASDPKTSEELMGSLDKDGDRELTFSEFWKLIGDLAREQGGFNQ